MPDSTIRAAYSTWPATNRAIRDVVASLTDAQLSARPAPERWPLWATVGHLACQRVSWLCGFAGETGAETTPFPDALYRCPGDEYLEPSMSPDELAAALDSTFRIIDNSLDTWTVDMLGGEIRRSFGEREMVYTRGSVIQRVFAHDIYHAAELNESFSAAGLPLIDLWD